METFLHIERKAVLVSLLTSSEVELMETVCNRLLFSAIYASSDFLGS